MGKRAPVSVRPTAQFAIRQQSGIGGDRRTAKLEHQAAVEIEPQRTPVRFTRRVRHCCPGWSPTSYGILTHNRRECAENLRLIGGMRG